MPTDPAPDTLERIGREHAKRLGVEPHYDNEYGDPQWAWNHYDGAGNPNESSMLPAALAAQYEYPRFETESEAYRTLGQNILACELAIGLADRVREAVEAAAKIAENHWPHAQYEIADTIRELKGAS